MPLSFVLSAVRSQSLSVMEFIPSMQTPSERFEIRLASETVISAVEYIDGEPRPFVV